MRTRTLIAFVACLAAGGASAETLIVVTNGAAVHTTHFDTPHLCAEGRSMVLNDGLSIEAEAKKEAAQAAQAKANAAEYKKQEDAWLASHKDHPVTSAELREHCGEGLLGPKKCDTWWPLPNGNASLQKGEVMYTFNGLGSSFAYGYSTMSVIGPNTPKYAECFGDAATGK